MLTKKMQAYNNLAVCIQNLNQVLVHETGLHTGLLNKMRITARFTNCKSYSKNANHSAVVNYFER